MKAIINENSIGLYIGGVIQTVNRDHPRFEQIKEAVRQDDEDAVNHFINVTDAINKYGKGVIKINDGVVYHNGKRLSNHLTDRLSNLISEGFGVENLTNFIKNLYENPNPESIEELYLFLENFGLPLTEDGCFLAYKAVSNDYLDLWTHSISNKIGCSPEMDRELVNQNRSVHCLRLHCGAIAYAKRYGGITQKPSTESGNRLMIVKINPRDAVSVPNDGCEKLRTCRYTVVAEMEDYNKILGNAVYTCDAKPKNADFDGGETDDLVNKYTPKAPQGESDQLFFEGRRDGQLDAASGIPYKTPPMESKKYLRGYKHGYRKEGINIK